MEVLREEFGGTRYQPAPLLRRLVTAGRTGRKSGQGFYDHAGDATERTGTHGTTRNGGAVLTPRSITLLGPAADLEGELGAAAAAAGITVTPEPGQPTDLVLVAASPASPVLAAALAAGRPADTVGLSASGGRLAELITTPLTSPEAAAAAQALADALGLTAVRAPDRPGFLVGTLLYPHLADAVRMVQDGYASAADVDTAMTLGCGYPRGPLELLDAAGPATALAVLQAMHEAYGDPAFAPPPLLAERAAAGLGFRG
jgi:3-hydroxybutyryl-CoA dehydrogenase